MTDPFANLDSDAQAAQAAAAQLRQQLAAAQQALAAETAKDQADEATIAALQQQIAQLEAQQPPTPPPPPPPPPVKPSGIAWGVAASSAAELAAEEAALGKVAIIRYFQQAGEGITSDAFTFCGNRAVVCSSKVNPAEIAAGKWDAQITAKYRAAKAAGVRLYDDPWHEPEQELDAGEFTIADLTAAFTRMHGIARQVDPSGQTIRTIHILMGFQLNQGQSVDHYMPTDLSVVDVLGFDPYQQSPTYSAPPGHLLAKLAAYAAAHRKPWAVCEIGVNRLKFPGQAWYDTLTGAAREAATVQPAPEFVCYYDHNARPGTIDNIIRSDPKAVAAWKAGQAG